VSFVQIQPGKNTLLHDDANFLPMITRSVIYFALGLVVCGGCR